MFKLIFQYEIDLKTSNILHSFRNFILDKSPGEYRFFIQLYTSDKESLAGLILQAGNRERREKVGLSNLNTFNDFFKQSIEKDDCFQINGSKDIVFLLVSLTIHSDDLKLSHASLDLLYLIYS